MRASQLAKHTINLESSETKFKPLALHAPDLQTMIETDHIDKVDSEITVSLVEVSFEVTELTDS